MSSNKKKLLRNIFTGNIGCGCYCGRPKLSDIFDPKTKPKSKSTSDQKPSLFHSSSSSWERGGGHSMDDDEAYTSTTLSLNLDTSSLFSVHENDPNCSKIVSMCPKICDSVAVVKDSDDPFLDFRLSMFQMILEKEIYSEEDLQELLNCFLQLNSPNHHEIIVQAFMDILDVVFSTWPISEKPYVSQGSNKC